MVSECNSVARKTARKIIDALDGFRTSPILLEVLQKASNSLHTSM